MSSSEGQGRGPGPPESSRQPKSTEQCKTGGTSCGNEKKRTREKTTADQPVEGKDCDSQYSSQEKSKTKNPSSEKSQKNSDKLKKEAKVRDVYKPGNHSVSSADQAAGGERRQNNCEENMPTSREKTAVKQSNCDERAKAIRGAATNERAVAIGGAKANRMKETSLERTKLDAEHDKVVNKSERTGSRDSQNSGKTEQHIHHKRSLSDGSSYSKQRRDSQNGQYSDQGLVYDSEESHVRQRSARYNRADSRTDYPPRLLVVSSKIKNVTSLQNALLPNVNLVQYKYESSTLDSLLGHLGQVLQDRRVESVAFLLHGPVGVIHIAGKEEQQITKDTILDHAGLRRFFTKLFTQHSSKEAKNLRLDFLACNTAQVPECRHVITKELETLLKIPVGMWKDVIGFEMPPAGEHVISKSLIGDLYFRLDRLRSWSGHYQQSLAGFEKIRTVGKGAYGAAVLYRKRDDDSLVILKEINMHDLNATERQLALNEVKVLAVLDHPNIISYYDSFEEDGVLMIEMEYANGGTLAQYLSSQNCPLEEKEILGLFHQMVAAIRHIHEHNILHRDLKTANIFLTKEGVVKVGDFGISKMMTTSNKNANTVLGTPYYISPEMCEGKVYNDKSDIWALGCILYEMACLQKTFEGSNLPALVNKIMKGQFAPVRGNYSEDFKSLIRDMLEREPEYRPSANELMYRRLPDLIQKFDDTTTDYEDDVTTSVDSAIITKKKTSANVSGLEKRSVLYYLETCSMSLSPLELPAKVKIREVAIGSDHVIVVSMERAVFTWGQGCKGQLGHGTLESLTKPCMVEALRGKSITRACCGEGYSVFASDNGIVMTCGDGTSGCLGHGDWCSTSRPRLIEALLSVDVVAVASGTHHVVTVGSDGEVHSWGKGTHGQLGLGNDEDSCQPMEVRINEPVFVRDVRCGSDGTMLLTDVGSLYACGNNTNNKLGLNQRQGFLMAMKNIFNKTEVECRKEPTLVKAMTRHRVVDVSMGRDHTAILIEAGRVYTLGKNSEGQLGMGNTRPQQAPVEVKALLDKRVTRAQCGDHYTVVSTADNELYFWGVRFTKPATPLEDCGSKVSEAPSGGGHRDSVTSTASLLSIHEQESSENSVSALAMKSSDDPAPPVDQTVKCEPPPIDGAVSSSMTSETSMSASSTMCRGFRPLSSTPRRTPSANSSREKAIESSSTLGDDMEVILHPTHILRLQTSNATPHAEMVYLSNFFCHGENLFVQVETTAPPPKRKSRKKRSFRKRFSTNYLPLPQVVGSQHPASASSREGGDEYSSETSEMDTYGTIPQWIKQELALPEAERNMYSENGFEESDSDSTLQHAVIETSMSRLHVNANLRPGEKHKKSPPGKRSISVAHQMAPRHNDQESGIEFTPVDPLSSSSGDETSDPSLHVGKRRQTHHGIQAKTRLGIPRKISAPVPHKSKNSPTPGQKPIGRFHAKGDGPSSVASVSRMRAANMEGELAILKTEKQCIEDRLRKMEDLHRKQSDIIKQESENVAKERERQLMQEIHVLRSELTKQNDKLKDNYNCMRSLQEELIKVQSEQRRISAREQRAKQQQVQRESKVCIIQ